MSLQRDFAIYVVNLFSLPQCSKVLSLERDDMAWLLKRFCGVDRELLCSRADWRCVWVRCVRCRVRPFTEVHVRDLRQDVHFMNMMYRAMKKQCIEQSPLQLNLVGVWGMCDSQVHDVLARSNELCLFSYEKPLYSFEMGKWLIPK